MSDFYAFYEYLESGGEKLFTAVCLPAKTGKFPIIIYRTPYADSEIDADPQALADRFAKDHLGTLAKGYGYVYQHCRGRGKSSGDFLPYINEREDGLNLQDWIRKQPFYSGVLLLDGASYTSSVHLVCAPFADDVKAAVLAIQDCERYAMSYRNGFLKTGSKCKWTWENYKKNTLKERKSYSPADTLIRPFTDFSKVMFGEGHPSIDEASLHPDPKDEFWNTRLGGVEAKGAVKDSKTAILLLTGFYDIYTHGMFEMWRSMGEETRARSAFVVHPYDHRIRGTCPPIAFEGGDRGGIITSWFEHVLKGAEPPVEVGRVTYYEIFDNRWHTDDFVAPEKSLTFTLGEGERTYIYDPENPASFRGALTNSFGGSDWQDKPNSRQDIISLYTPEFSVDTEIKGQMRARLRVRSSCEDTCFYMRISLAKEEGDFGLRDDINQISAFKENYLPGEEAEIEFSFDEHAFLVKKGEKLRIDISSSCYPTFFCHTNVKGLYSVQKETKIAENTVILDKSYLNVFVNERN